MIVLRSHLEVSRLYAVVVKLVWRYELQETPRSVFPTGIVAPTKEEIESVKQRATAVQESISVNVGPFRIARDRLTDHEPLIERRWLSFHEWIVDRCQQLLREISGESLTNTPRDDVFDETVQGDVLAALTAEANLAAELFPNREPVAVLAISPSEDREDQPEVTSPHDISYTSSLDARAMAIYADDTTLRKVDIARLLRIKPQNLNKERCPKLHDLIQAHKGKEPPQGSKSSDGQIEAWTDDFDDG